LSAFALNSGATPTQIDMLGNVSIKDDPNTVPDPDSPLSELEGGLSVENSMFLKGSLYLQRTSLSYGWPSISIGLTSNNSLGRFGNIVISETGNNYMGDVSCSYIAGESNNISGNHLFVAGNGNYAGDYSLILGYNSTTSNLSGYGIVVGNNSSASEFALALGQNSHAMSNAIAIGSSHAYSYSLAIGDNSYASGCALAIGYNSEAGGFSFSIGTGTYSNALSIAYGSGSRAEARCSFAGGNANKAIAYGQVVLGTYNDYSVQGISDQIEIADGIDFDYIRMDDPLFILGNGTSYENRSNALVVLRNGNTQINGALNVQETVRAKRGGDIFMGEYGRAEDSGSAN